MKSDVMPSRVQMEKEVFNKLVKEVQETLAADVKAAKETKSSFGVVDLWNIQRNARPAYRLVRRWAI
jgi:hypothetical protein